jgi:hypothetical protein
MLQRVVDGDKGRVRGCPVAKPRGWCGEEENEIGAKILGWCGELSPQSIDKLI